MTESRRDRFIRILKSKSDLDIVEFSRDAVRELIEVLEEPERTGRWVDYIGKDLGIEGQWLRDDRITVFIQCDQCGGLLVRNLMIHANYCPQCGAEMEVESP